MSSARMHSMSHQCLTVSVMFSFTLTPLDATAAAAGRYMYTGSVRRRPSPPVGASLPASRSGGGAEFRLQQLWVGLPVCVRWSGPDERTAVCVYNYRRRCVSNVS